MPMQGRRCGRLEWRNKSMHPFTKLVTLTLRNRTQQTFGESPKASHEQHRRLDQEEHKIEAKKVCVCVCILCRCVCVCVYVCYVHAVSHLFCHNSC